MLSFDIYKIRHRMAKYETFKQNTLFVTLEKSCYNLSNVRRLYSIIIQLEEIAYVFLHLACALKEKYNVKTISLLSVLLFSC